MPSYYIPKEKFKIIWLRDILPYVNSADEVDPKAPELKHLIQIAWLTGARLSEIIQLKKEDFWEDEEGVTIHIKALKHGGSGYPTFSYEDPFIREILDWVKERNKLFTRGKRRYQQMLQELNYKVWGKNKEKWITFHYLRHSRLTYLARVLKAFPEQYKAWTGHRSSAFEEYFASRRVSEWRGKFGR